MDISQGFRQIWMIGCGVMATTLFLMQPSKGGICFPIKPYSQRRRTRTGLQCWMGFNSCGPKCGTMSVRAEEATFVWSIQLQSMRASMLNRRWGVYVAQNTFLKTRCMCFEVVCLRKLHDMGDTHYQQLECLDISESAIGLEQCSFVAKMHGNFANSSIFGIS